MDTASSHATSESPDHHHIRLKVKGSTDSASSHATSESPDHHHIRLACQACQRKKIKCDRNFPCGQCTRSNLQCAPSSRKPRARHAGKRAIDSELRSRISKLENLVESLSGEVGLQDGISGNESDAQAGTKDLESPAVGRYIGSPFWSSLTTEVQALREALEDELPEDDDPTSPSSSSGLGTSAEYDLIVCPPGSVYVMPGALAEPTPRLSATLCNIFCDNVDRMFKFYHAPTLRAFMIEGKPYLGHDHSAPCNKALKAAIWFAATNSLSEAQCQMTFGKSRADQLQQFRRTVDVAMAQADLMNTNDLATLQGFTTYVAASRLTDQSRRVWTLTAVLVRIARAMGLHHDVVGRSPFETELRRRLWHTVRFLDVFSGLDRGTELLVGINSYDTPRPRNTNDSEFDESSTSIPDYETGLTDMSFARLAYDATHHTHRLTIPESKPNGDTWRQRLEFAQGFEEMVKEKYLKYCDTSDPYQRLLSTISKSMTASMKLRAVRPLHKHISSVPPRVDDPFVLQLARDSLKSGEEVYTDPETEKYRWMVWVPWHPLAVALAGLCAIRDTDLAKDAWVYVEKAYARQGRYVADARHGMLWRPIEKLYKKASAFREHRDETPSDFSPPQKIQGPPVTSSYPAPQIDPSLAQSIPHTLPGAMPTGGVLNSPMNLDFGKIMMPIGGMDLVNNDMNWMDFQNIFEDMSTPAPEMNMGDIPWPQNVPPEQDWPGLLHQNQNLM